jgi:ABC-type lipoprotein release transport system permease subunit
MGTLLKIASRNVVRNKRRTAITGIVMMFGIGLYICADSILSGMDRMTIDNMVQYTDSFLKIRTPEYVSNLQGNPLDYGIPDPEGVMEKILASDAGIKAAAPRTRFVARLSNYVDEIPVVAAAIDPARDGKVLSIADNVVQGVWLDASGPKSVVMGAALAEELGLGLGDYVLISASTVYENVNADEYEIVGLINSPIPELNKSSLFMTYADADELLGLNGLVTEIVTAGGTYPALNALLAGSDAAAATLSKSLPGLQADSIHVLAQDYLAMRAMKGKFSSMIILVILLIAGVGIVNTILMSVYSRIREIGVLRAYGMTAKEIRRLFTLEGLIVGAAGSLAGVLLGVALVWLMATQGISWQTMIGNVDMGGIPIAGKMYGEWNPATMVTGFLFGMIVAFISARIPAKRAAKMQVTDALRFV